MMQFYTLYPLVALPAPYLGEGGGGWRRPKAVAADPEGDLQSGAARPLGMRRAIGRAEADPPSALTGTSRDTLPQGNEATPRFTAMTTALSIRDIGLHYGAAQALRGISIEAKPGRITAVLGRNGVGKSSTLRAVTGINNVSSGEIVFNDEVLKKAPPYKRARLGIGYVPQGREVFPLLTVKENLETGYAPLKAAERHVPGYIYELFPILKSMLGRRGGDLSGGQQQQLAIGRALVTRPKVLVLDEPTEGIQPSIIKDIGRALQFLRDQKGMTILLVEQYLDFCREIADDIYIMDRGEIMHSGPAADLDLPEVRRHLMV